MLGPELGKWERSGKERRQKHSTTSHLPTQQEKCLSLYQFQRPQVSFLQDSSLCKSGYFFILSPSELSEVRCYSHLSFCPFSLRVIFRSDGVRPLLSYSPPHLVASTGKDPFCGFVKALALGHSLALFSMPLHTNTLSHNTHTHECSWMTGAKLLQKWWRRDAA